MVRTTPVLAARTLLLLLFILAMGSFTARALECDLSQYRPQAGLEAAISGEELVVRWTGTAGNPLRLRLTINQGVPMIRAIELRKASDWIPLARNLVPEFGVTTGVRRSGHGLLEENRWDVYWDAPLSIPGAPTGNPNLPRKPEEVRKFKASYQATGCKVKTDGARLEISFPGVSMGIFSGSLQFTVYRGTSLLRQELIAKTDEPSVAFKYYGGLAGFALLDFAKVAWRDVGGNPQEYGFGGSPNEDPVALRARNRLAIVTGKNGSIAFFPPPHQFFFARQLEVNLGYVWYRKDSESAFSIGIRHGDSHEGYNPTWIQQVFALYNAPPGTWQRMPIYFFLSPENAGACRDSAMAFTHGDRYKPLPGYKTLVTHFHTAFAQELLNSGSLDTLAPWIPAMRALGINIAHIFDFHGDGHPRDPGPLRLKELEDYFAACRRHSDRDFLILPGEEANAYLGGHYNILFPKPVFWTQLRPPAAPFVEDHARYGKVYHTGSAADIFELMKAENALVWQTHPRTKGSTFYPDKIRETDYFKSDQWLGAAFKALPVDLSQKRLGEIRCLGTLDDMNNWGRPKHMMGEVDTYKKFPEYDLYGDFNVNYLKLDRTPGFDDWSAINRALRDGDFFVATGEVLIRDWKVKRTGAHLDVTADIEWTFPLEFVEVVWGDGEKTDRQIISATDLPPFGSKQFRVRLSAGNKKWVRFAAWDSAVNGAFTQPIHLK
ncbi:MAG: hypothetical protein HYY23_07070 [Verrucomicrobia bacterium]|nr:hypothetical protein [Verrucomicrobiota bacterium]